MCKRAAVCNNNCVLSATSNLLWLTAAVLRQVETLAGQVVAVDVDAGATLGAMREGIARQTGILVKQQRLIVLGEPHPSP